MAKKITVEVLNAKKLERQIERMKMAPEKALKAAEHDIRKRAPGWIASGVVDRYNLEGGKNKGKTAIAERRIGRMKIKGSLANDAMRFEYSGRSLTPVHFGMTPTERPKPGSTYTLKWKVLQDGKGNTAKIRKLTKKQRKALGKNFTRTGAQNSPQSPWMLQPTGNTKEGGTNYIPFQRRGQTDPFRYVARGPSLPQMIKDKNGELHPEVAKHFNENLEKRISHNINRFMPKK